MTSRDRSVATGQAATAKALLGRGSMFAVGQALQLGAAVLIVPLITRLLDPVEYGEVASALAISRVLAVVAALGLPAAITLEYFQGPRGRESARFLVISTVIVAGSICGAIALSVPLWSGPLISTSAWSARLAVVNAGLLAGVIACQSLLQAQHRITKFVLLIGVSTLGGQAAGLTLVALVTPSATMYLLGLMMGYLAAALLGLAWTIGRHVPNWNPHVWRPALAIGLPTVPHSVALYVLALGDRIVVGHALGLKQVARYDLAYQVGALTIVAITAVNQAWAPIVYGTAESERWTTLAHTSRLVTRLSAQGCVLIAFIMPLLLTLVAPPEYAPHDLAPVATITALCAGPFSVYLSRVHVVFQQRATKILAWSSPTAAVIGIGACIGLVAPWGLIGAALASLVGYLIQATLTSRASRQLASVPWDNRSTLMTWLLATAAVSSSLAMPAAGAWMVVRSTIAIAALVGMAGTIVAAISPRQVDA